jgi:flagellar basal body P-ring protein FlgI
MAGALNIFKTVLANVTTSSSTVYSTPLGYSTVVLMAQISNIDVANTITVSANVVRTGDTTALVKNTQVPVADAISVLTGRLIMSFGDSFEVSANANDSAQLTLSLLETLTG